MEKPKIIQDPGPWKGTKNRGKLPEGIVIHGMGQYIGGEYASEFLKKHYSVHAFIDPNGTIIKAVPPEKTAWHAGVSNWYGLQDLNLHFLGVELLVSGDFLGVNSLYKRMKEDCYTENQYRSLAYLCNEWKALNPVIDNSRIVGHDAVSGDNVRGYGKGKRDPGPGFDWRRLHYLMAGI